MDNENIAVELGKLQVAMAEVSTTVKLGFAQHTGQLEAQAAQLKTLNEKTDLALLPIKLGKALVAVIGGASVITGCIYGAYQFIVGNGP